MRKAWLSLLLITSSAAAAHYTQADIGLWINSKHQSEFYSVLVNEHQQPYLNINNILTAWFGLKATCDVATLSCQGFMPPDATPFSINGKNHLMHYGKKIEYIPDHSLVKKDGKLWLNYQAFAKWLPITAVWSLQHYYLQFSPQYPLPEDILANRKRQIRLQQQQAQLKKNLQQQKALTPQAAISAEARYRLNWQPSFSNWGKVGASSAMDIDIGRGTFYASGNVGYDPADSSDQSVYWNYTLHRPGSFYQLRFGDTTVNSTLLIPYLSLQNGIDFSRLKPAQGGGGGFEYVGHTMPWTNVDIYRNGTLISTQTAKSDGSYRIDAPQALGGDIFTIVMFYKDGERKSKQIKVADDYGLLLEKNNWNVTLDTGQLLNHHWFTHVAYRYGVSNDLSIGAHALLIPSLNHKQTVAGMMDLAWRPKSWLDFLAEDMQDDQGNDYDVIADMSYFKKHTLRLEVKNINPDSPVAALNDESNNLLSSVLERNDQHSVALKDIWDVSTWRVTTGLLHDAFESSITEQADGQMNSRWSAVLNAGLDVSRYDGNENSSYASAVFDYQLNTIQLLEFGHAWFSDADGESSITYRYQGYQSHRLQASLGAQISNHGDITLNGSLSWRLKRHWLLTANIDDDSVNGVISYEGLVSKGANYRNYDDFGTGSVAGYVMAPPSHPGDKPTPIVGATVQVDNALATTDKYGFYFVPDVVVNTRVSAHIDTNTINANLIPRRKAVVMDLRPGTIVYYNPQLVWAGGIDGQVMSPVRIPKGTEVLAERCHDHNLVVAHADVEDDGFFVFNRLAIGHYCLHLKDSTATMAAAKPVDIKPPQDWASGVILYAKAKHAKNH